MCRGRIPRDRERVDARAQSIKPLRAREGESRKRIAQRPGILTSARCAPYGGYAGSEARLDVRT